MGRELKNEFAWSKSRDEVFRECLRKYYFQYYGFWGGWFENAPSRTREIYVLKQLKTRQMWAGEHVHRRIEKILSDLRRGREPPSADQAVEQTLADMREEFKQSRAGLYRKSPKKACALFEHEYGQEVPNEEWKANADHVANCIRNFCASETFARIRALARENWLELEERQSFLLDGLKVLVQLDFACRDGAEVLVYDWKTGRGETGGGNDLQLACYVLYAADRWKVSPAGVTAIEFNLAAAAETRRVFTDLQLAETRAYIHDSADEMLFPLADPENNVAEEEAFDFTEDERVCRRCNFVKVCPKWGGSSEP